MALSIYPVAKAFALTTAELLSVKGPGNANIVQIHEVGEQDGHHYIARQLIQGGPSCRDTITSKDNAEGAVGLMATVAEAVHYAHQRGVLHRDLKPSRRLCPLARVSE